MVFLKEFFKKVDFEKKSADDKKTLHNFPLKGGIVQRISSDKASNLPFYFVEMTTGETRNI